MSRLSLIAVSLAMFFSFAHTIDPSRAQSPVLADMRASIAGRGYVEAFVTYIHYVERLYEAAEKPAAGHYEED